MSEPSKPVEDDLVFLDESAPAATPESDAATDVWRIMIIDDDADVHSATTFALGNLEMQGRALEFLHAYSAVQARDMLKNEQDIAVILLDVVMEQEDAGLQLVRYIRDTVGMTEARIILRTGQPGYAPEIDAIRDFDINDYKTKSELTRTRLYTVLTAAIRSYKQIRALESNRQGLELIVEGSAELSRLRGLHRFAEGVVTQLCALLGILPEGLICAQAGSDRPSGPPRIIAAAGQYSGMINAPLSSVQVPQVRKLLERCLTERKNIYEDATCLYFGLSNDRAIAALVDVGHALQDIDRQLLLAFCSNITVGFENVMLYTQLLDHAYNDQLLQLPNRTRFIELLEQNLKQPQGITLALVDLDDFAEINDAFGHQFGDQVLLSVVSRLSQHLGFNSSMARISGDTFGILGPEGLINATGIEALFADPFNVVGERLQISATTGLVRLTDSASVGSELLLDAQIALKRAKQQNRGSSQYFSSAMGQDARERFKLLKGLRAGFEERRLFVVYQPQIDLETGKVIAAEALLRWKTEEGKFVPPDQFIPLAEQSGLIINIGEFVLRTACYQVKQLRSLGHADFRMAVNISMAQFRHPNFMDVLNNALRDTGIEGHCLELEITESMAMEDIHMVQRVLSAIRGTGATVAIDDFGTGFSSLSQLRQLKVERLKIDRAFVQEAQNSNAGYTIAQMVINLGRGLGMRVIAEGIETDEQRQHLLSMGCHEGQGYLFARPMTAEDLVLWMDARR